MNRRAAFAAVLLLLTALALVLRTASLDNRPFHADEAVHALKFRELYEKGVYRYDPNEFHGPTIYYAALPVVFLRGRADFAATQISDYRLVTALFGAGMICWLFLLSDATGKRAACIAALFLAVSPACVFYSRYYIQETPFAFFTLGLIACLWRYICKPSLLWAISVGMCAGLMIASKETALLTFAALFLSAILLSLRGVSPLILWRLHGKAAGIAVLVAVMVAALFISNFFAHPAALWDYLRSYVAWVNRAQATDFHRHPWHYYLVLLLGPHRQRGGFFYSEAIIFFLAIIGVLKGFRRQAPSPLPPPPKKGKGEKEAVVSSYSPSPFLGRGGRGEGGAATSNTAFIRFLSLYTLLLTAIYSAIPYKTPWCVLSFLTGYCLLAGVGTAALWDGIRSKIGRGILVVLLSAAIAHLGWQAYRASFVAFADPRNPYVYSPTAPEVEELAEQIIALAKTSPDGDRMIINVYSIDEYYWPLPWYLRRFPNVGYWTKTPADAPLILASPQFDEELTRRLKNTHIMTGFYGLRPGVLLQLWVRDDFWQRFLKSPPK